MVYEPFLNYITLQNLRLNDDDDDDDDVMMMMMMMMIMMMNGMLHLIAYFSVTVNEMFHL